MISFVAAGLGREDKASKPMKNKREKSYPSHQ